LSPLEDEVERLRDALGTIRLHSLLAIRRAAFAPTLGVRYSEAIRADIASECARLEQFIDATLAKSPASSVSSSGT
jgi:hypothetical protein